MINTLAWGIAGAWMLFLGRWLLPRQKRGRFHPVTLLTWSWAIMFWCSATQIIQFPQITPEPWLYLVGFASLILLGAALVTRLPLAEGQSSQVTREGFVIPPHLRRLTGLVIALGVVGVLLSLSEAFLFREFSLSAAVESRDVGAIITFARVPSWLTRMGTFTLPCAWLAVALVVLFAEDTSRRARWGGILCGAGIVALTISTAGRTMMIRLVFLIIVSVWMRRGMGLKPWPWRWDLPRAFLMFLILTAGAWYFVNVWAWRAGKAADVTLDVTSFFPEAREAPLWGELLRETPTTAHNLTNWVATSAVTEADNFAAAYSRVYQVGNWPGPYGGAWLMFGWTDGLARMGLPVKPLTVMYSEVDVSMARAGLYMAQWRTMAQQYMLDFGWGGALIAAFSSGVGLGYVHRGLRSGGMAWAPLSALVGSWALYGAWTSPLDVSPILVLFYCAAYIVADRVLGADRRQHQQAVRVSRRVPALIPRRPHPSSAQESRWNRRL